MVCHIQTIILLILHSSIPLANFSQYLFTTYYAPNNGAKSFLSYNVIFKGENYNKNKDA